MGARSLRSLDFCTGTTREFQSHDAECGFGTSTTSTSNLLEDGAVLGRYRIVRWLARGSAGTVYEALLPGPLGFSKRMALKVFRTRLDSKGRAKLDHVAIEARLAGLLQHPNLVGTHDFGEINGQYYLAMEYVDGVTLAEMLKVTRKRKRLIPRAAVLTMAQQLCWGLQHAHQLRDAEGQAMGLVHLDLKPANVMVDTCGTTKILDFGVARIRSQRSRWQVPKHIQGTPRYMSPEQVTADKRLDHRSDLFSLGAVLHELITGRPLFGTRSVTEVMRTIAYSDARKRLYAAEARLPGIRSVLDSCLDPVPGRRFPAAKAVGLQLEGLQTRNAAQADLARFVSRIRPDVEALRSRQREREHPGLAGPSPDPHAIVVPFRGSAGLQQSGRRESDASESSRASGSTVFTTLRSMLRRWLIAPLRRFARVEDN